MYIHHHFLVARLYIVIEAMCWFLITCTVKSIHVHVTISVKFMLLSHDSYVIHTCIASPNINKGMSKEESVFFTIDRHTYSCICVHRPKGVRREQESPG